jgi:protein-S-isoprenylcysteine O-methyltransferase Ste14
MRNYILNYSTILIAIAGFALIILNYLQIEPGLNISKIIGLALMIPSLSCILIARIELGDAFQVSAKANKLVTKGLYKKLRHPIYYFAQVLTLGLIIFIHKYYLLIIWVALILIQMRRMKKEEKLLEEKFGDEYRNYKKNTWF